MQGSSSSRPGFDVEAIIGTLWGSFQLHGSNSGLVLGPYEIGLGGETQSLHRFKSDIELEPMIEHLCGASREIFRKEPSLLRLRPPITIAGNFYGEFSKLKSILEQDGPPPRTNYLFLGNYVDSRGLFLHTILLLLAFKIKYPQNVFLLKGELDHAGIRPNLLLVDEADWAMRSVSSSSLDILNDCLKYLPDAALAVSKYKDFAEHGVVFVSSSAFRWPELLDEYKYMTSADDPELLDEYKYMTSADDDNTVMRVDVSLTCYFHNLRYKKRLWSYQIGKASTAQDVCSSGVNPSSGKVSGSKPETNDPSKIQFDPTNLYRSKSPGVKRFLGARV